MRDSLLSLLTISLNKPFEKAAGDFLSRVCDYFEAKGYSLIVVFNPDEPMVFLSQGISEEYRKFVQENMEKLPGRFSYLRGEIMTFEEVRKLSPENVKEALLREGILSYITIPLGWEGKVFGVLALYFDKRRKFKKKFIEELKVLASVFSSHLNNHFLFSTLLEREKTLNTIFESSPAAIFVIQDMKYKVVNPAFEKLTGYSAEEAENLFFWEVVHPDQQEEVKERGIRREKGERVQPELYEMKIVDKMGRQKWALFKGTPIKFGGRPANLGIAFDITEKKKLEERLSSLKENLKAIYESSVMGIYLFDLEKGIYEMVNPKGKELLGMNLEKKRPEEVFPPEEVERINEILNYIKKTKKTLTTVEKYHTGLGERFIFVSRAPVFGRDGKVKKIVGIFRDITEEERAKHEWERRADFSMVEKLIEVVAKELNNILSIILAISEIGLESGIDETNWKRIHDKAKEAQNFIYQLMEIGKGESGGKTTVELNEFVKSKLLLFKTVLPERVELKFYPWPSPLYILCNPSALRTAISHLLINAKEAMENEGIIEITLEREKDFAVLRIRDTGKGMNEQEISRAFEPFFSTKSLEENPGLGLTFVKKFVEKSGGSIQIESAPGKGTAVSLKLPLSPEPPKEAKEIEKRAPSAEILLVEDDPDVRRVEYELLTVLGYKVAEVSSAAQALEMIKERPPSIVITDLSMPGMGGAQLAQEIKKISPSIKVLLISGYVSEDELEDFKKMGIDEILHKPFGLDELRKTLQNLT